MTDLDRLREAYTEEKGRSLYRVTAIDITMKADALIAALEQEAKGLEAENERLRCCGNCEMRNVDECDAYNPPGQKEIMYVVPDDHCHFTPSRWTRREEP